MDAQKHVTINCQRYKNNSSNCLRNQKSDFNLKCWKSSCRAKLWKNKRIESFFLQFGKMLGQDNSNQPVLHIFWNYCFTCFMKQFCQIHKQPFADVLSTEKTFVSESLLQKRLQHRRFLVDFVKFFKNIFFMEHLRLLLL